MKKAKHAIIWVLVLAALGAAGWGGWKYWKSRKTADVDKDSIVSAAKGDLKREFSDIGGLNAKDIVDVNAKASGRITQLFTDEGVLAKKGDPLFEAQAGKSESEKYVPITVTSPLDGLVMRCVKQSRSESALFPRVGDRIMGSYDSSDPTCVMQIADMRRIVVDMKISEVDILKLRQGMPVDVSVDALPGKNFTGKVSLIAPQAETSYGGIKKFTVQVMLDKPDPAFRIGMTARVTAVLESRKNVLKIPLSALFEEKGETFAYLYKEGEKPLKTSVKPGLRAETEAEVLSGLKEGDKLLIEKPVEGK